MFEYREQAAQRTIDFLDLAGEEAEESKEPYRNAAASSDCS